MCSIPCLFGIFLQSFLSFSELVIFTVHGLHSLSYDTLLKFPHFSLMFEAKTVHEWHTFYFRWTILLKWWSFELTCLSGECSCRSFHCLSHLPSGLSFDLFLLQNSTSCCCSSGRKQKKLIKFQLKYGICIWHKSYFK